jgi:hypothetical protein
MWVVLVLVKKVQKFDSGQKQSHKIEFNLEITDESISTS